MSSAETPLLFPSSNLPVLISALPFYQGSPRIRPRPLPSLWGLTLQLHIWAAFTSPHSLIRPIQLGSKPSTLYPHLTLVTSVRIKREVTFNLLAPLLPHYTGHV